MTAPDQRQIFAFTQPGDQRRVEVRRDWLVGALRFIPGAMSEAIFGRIVCVRSPLADESGWLATIWFVAIDDDEAAMDVVRSEANVTPDDDLLVVGQLEPDAVQKLALAPGEAATYP